MFLSTAHLETDRPDRYIKQLVSHLAHKIDANVGDDGVGHVSMPSGAACTLTADVTGIAMHAQAPDEDELRRVEDVVGRHLLRFTKDEQLSRGWARA